MEREWVSLVMRNFLIERVRNRFWWNKGLKIFFLFFLSFNSLPFSHYQKVEKRIDPSNERFTLFQSTLFQSSPFRYIYFLSHSLPIDFFLWWLFEKNLPKLRNRIVSKLILFRIWIWILDVGAWIQFCNRITNDFLTNHSSCFSNSFFYSLLSFFFSLLSNLTV